MYSLSMSAVRTAEASSIIDQNSLIQQMLEDGLALKKNTVNGPSNSDKHQLLLSDEEEEKDEEKKFLKKLNKKQKKALLK